MSWFGLCTSYALCNQALTLLSSFVTILLCCINITIHHFTTQALITLVIIGAVSSIYYVQVAKKRQKFSKDELKVTFVVHVMKMEHLTNAARKSQIVGRMNMNPSGPRKKKKKNKQGDLHRVSSMSLRNALNDAVAYISPSRMRRR